MQEWKVYEFKELVNLSKEKYNPKNETMNLPCIELEHIESETGRLLGYTDSIEQQSIKNKFKANDILYGKLRPYLRKFYFPNFEGVCSSEIWVLQSIEEKIHNKYLYYLIQTNKFNEHANKSSGTKMPRADWNYISEITFPIPPIKEQQKIASILSTWDKAIELKEKLIEQKKQQKKGLMQKLLTGEVRLPGFEGKWRSLRILNFCNTYSGGTPSRTRKEFYENGTIPWIKSGELNSRKVTQTEEYITEKALANSTAKLVNPETILLALYGATAGVVAMSKIRASINQAILAIVPNDNCDNNFLFYYLENHMDKVTKKYTQGGQPNLNADIVKKMVVKLPSIEEQKAIANILSNIDNNIELLEKELNWLKQQKKGLMQLLLTGKVRVKV
ncbi:restriction endonuclease subunit S [Heyndrickxia coagulans]|uniref:restriction endonuclease subunit S n=1 Tax=Heyndrickxia coagulans TaxID=1398 RepID=UPI001EEDA84C|nr:restriction endonuclease subunit S [Heyndrickxia coagulans]UJZ87087.1 restriction endonuclease subunit S [Heyndrickxia coagulans]